MMITNRDLSLIDACDRYGVITTNQIKALAFRSTDKRTMLRRLCHLEKYKVIERFGGLPLGKLAWTLGPRGRSLSSGATPVRLMRNSLEHDCMVTAVRIALDKMGLGTSWSSHFEIRSQAAKTDFGEVQIPDATFIVPGNSSDTRIALEVELSLKSKTRYQKLLSTYYHQQGISFVWYVLQNECQLRTLKKIIEEKAIRLGRPTFGFSTMGALLANSSETSIFMGEKRATIGSQWQMNKTEGST